MPSYSPVFSQGFIYYADASPNTIFEVPSGFTAVVRDVDIVCIAGGVTYAVSVQLDDSAPIINFVAGQIIAPVGSEHWEGRVVVAGGGFIELYVSSISLDTYGYIGGYLLRNTAT